MADEQKSKKELLSELGVMRQRISEFEQSEIEQTRAEEVIQRQLLAQVALRNASAAISSSLSMETVMNQIVEELGGAVDATSAYINLYELISGTTTVIAKYIGPEANAAEKVSDLHSEYPEVDEFVFQERDKRMRSGQHDVAHQGDADLTSYERVDMEEDGVKSKLYIPLLIRDEFIGYAEIWETRMRREFTSVEIDLCKDLAQQAAIALENARLYEQAQVEITERKQAEMELQKVNIQFKHQLAEIQQLETSLREQAIRDPLTRVFNRRYMDVTLKKELIRAARKDEPLSVVILDLDNLKNINDTYGHVEGGDKSLQILANTIKKMSRKDDTVCRYAGDEFLVILYDTSAQVAYKRALEWKEAVSEIKIETDEGEFSITFSAGVSTFPDHTSTAEELLIQADQALYSAKEQGRDQIVVYGEDVQKYWQERGA